MPNRTGSLLATTAAALLCLSGPAGANDPATASPQASSVGRIVAGLAAPAPKRVAIVIGNAEYDNAPDLINVEADAEIVAAFLREHGYRVLEYADLDKLGFERMLRQALFEIDKDSELVFYFAGHGIQVGGGNYIVPSDASLESPYDLPFEAISLANVVDVLGARARVQLVVLDSCRENPFDGRSMLAEVSRAVSEVEQGFSVPTAPINSLLAFSTSPGQIAWDGGEAGNSPFTEALIEVARRDPERPVAQILEQVRRLVFQRTNGRQVPWESSTLVQPVAFATPTPSLLLYDGDAAIDPGIARSMLNVTTAQAAVFNRLEPGAETREPVVLSARLEREVDVGKGLAEALDMPPDVPVKLSRQPEDGVLVVQNSSGLRTDAQEGDLSQETLDLLVYDSRISAERGQRPEARVDRFELVAGDALMEVQLRLEPDPCDEAAGDHLDPEGVGIAKYPNEIMPERALEACAAAVAADPDNGRFQYQLGRAHLALRQFGEARAAFERARDLGHTRAWYALGNLTAFEQETTGGVSDSPAPPEALALYEEGVAAGDPYALHGLGKQLLRHGLTETERQRGFDLLNRAVELGHTFAMNELGSYYLDPDSPDADPDRGLRYFKESAARDDIYGFNNMGVVYRDGLAGLDADVEAAVDWFKRAAERGHPTAPAALGRLWNSGALGTGEQAETAVAWYDLGLERGDAWSGANAAWIIANRGVEGMTATDAAVRAAKAAALRNEGAAAEARSVLAGLPRSAIDAAAQTLVSELGGDIAIDGAFGPGSRAAMEKVLAARGEPMPPDDPVERTVALAGAYWRGEAFRVDLY